MSLKEKLTKLVSYKTTHGNKKYIRELKKLYNDVIACNTHINYEFVESNDYPSLLLYTKSLNKPKLVLQSHVDVVPADKDMFEATINRKGEEEIMVGRGVFDMKFAVACFMKFLEEMDKEINNLDISIWLTPDEEIGGFNGVNYIVNELGYGSECILLPDGSTGSCITTASKGLVHFEVQVDGASAHASRPWQGENAIEKIYKIYAALQNTDLLKNTSNGGKSGTNEWENTIELTVVEGGKANNQVPDSARARFDLRFVEPNTLQSVEEVIKRTLKKYDAKYTKLTSGDNFYLSEDNKYRRLFESKLKEHGIEYGFVKDYGSSDARFFTPHGIPVVVFMPDGGDQHGEAEWINLNSLESYYKVFKDFVLEVSRH